MQALNGRIACLTTKWENCCEKPYESQWVNQLIYSLQILSKFTVKTDWNAACEVNWMGDAFSGFECVAFHQFY